MRLVIQRVSRAKVTVEGEVVGEIGKGLLVLVGVGQDDSEKDIELLAEKLVGLRIFEDEGGKMNLSLLDIKGQALLVSQFTLYADCSKGRRPSFLAAMPPEPANALFIKFCKKIEEMGVFVATGVFGAKMEVELLNQGPVTILLETEGEGQPGGQRKVRPPSR